jgi:hypothetical protein
MNEELRKKLNKELTYSYLEGTLPELFVSSLQQQRAKLNRNWLLILVVFTVVVCVVDYYVRKQAGESQKQLMQESKYKYVRISEGGHRFDSLLDVKPTSDCKGYYISDNYDSIMPAGDYELKSIR